MFDKNIIQVYKSKGSKTRLVILCPRLKVNLMKYCVIASMKIFTSLTCVL